MIWHRRILVVLLVILLTLLLAFALLLTQLNATLASPAFYNDRMEQAGMYDFIYDGLLPAAFEDIDSANSPDVPIQLSDIQDDLINAAKEILRPQWLRDRFEMGTSAFIPYITGSTDSLSINIEFKDRVEQASAVIQSDILQGDAFERLYDEIIEYASAKFNETVERLLFPLTLSKDEIESTLRDLFVKDWVSTTMQGLIAGITPYLTTDANTFSVDIDFNSRIDASVPLIADLLGTQQTYDYVVEDVLVPAIEDYLGPAAALPYGITVTRSEIGSAIEEALPLSWFQAEFSQILGAVADYLKGQANSIRVTIGLVDRKPAIASALTDLAHAKLEPIYNSLPVYSMSEFLYRISHLPPDTLPDCRPAGLTYEEARAMIDIYFGDAIRDQIVSLIPNKLVLNEADLSEIFGPANLDILEDARNWIADYSTVTEADLINRLGEDGSQTLDDVRTRIASGYSFNEIDLREMLTKNGQNTDSLDSVRGWIRAGRTWLWALWVAPIILLLAVGLLVANRWRTRLLWALGVLLFVSLAFLVALAVTNSTVVEPKVHEITIDGGDSRVGEVLALKGTEIVDNSVGAFMSGMQWKALFMAIAAGVTIALIFAWSFADKRHSKYEGQDSGSDT